MTITLQTPMLGPVDMAASDFDAFRGHQYDNATVNRFAAALVSDTGICGLRTSIVAAQIAKETGYFAFGGDVTADAFNLAGLGATGGGVAGLRYPDIETGVRAVCAHHMTYHYGDVSRWPENVRAWQPLDQRYAAVLSTGRAGAVITIGDFTNGTWAYTASIPVGSLANGYATGIVEIANTLSNGDGKVITMQDFPDAAFIGSPVEYEATDFYGNERTAAQIAWFVVHDTEGHWQGDINILTHGSQSGSIHALLGREVGQIVVSVPLKYAAYAAGNDTLGDHAYQVELCKALDESGYTDWQYETLAKLFRWHESQGCTTPRKYFYPHPPDADNGPLPDEPCIIGHCGVPDPFRPGLWGGKSGHTDPGNDFDWPRLMALIESGGTVVNPPPVAHEIDGFVVGDGVWNLVAKIPDETTRLLLLGRCTTTEHDEYMIVDNPDPATNTTLKKVAQSVVCVRFERNKIIWDHARTAPPWDTRVPLEGEYVGPSDDVLVDAVLKSMSIAGVPVQ